MPRTVGVATIVVSLLAVAVASAVSSAGGSLLLGSSSRISQSGYKGYYDGHKDSYVITDVSSKSQAKALHINYSAALGSARNLPAQYFVTGPAAAAQIAVFGSEPGASDYNPLWLEVFVKWDAGVTPTLLTSDNQINALASKHELTLTATRIVLNAPILSVGK
jgi:hypothetical protein